MKAVPQTYWRKTRRLTLQLLLVWFLVTFVFTWFASELNTYSFLGFPLGFYMAAQGAILVYLVIIWVYNHRMKKLDREFSIEQE